MTCGLEILALIIQFIFDSAVFWRNKNGDNFMGYQLEIEETSKGEIFGHVEVSIPSSPLDRFQILKV